MADSAVEIRDLRMRYGRGAEAVDAVNGLDLVVRRGTITAVLGPNGAGKTTTIETCEGYRRPGGGTVRVLGLDPYAERRSLAARVGVMLQDGGAWSNVRAGELIRHMSRLHADPLDVPYLMDRLGLAGRTRTTYRQLSGGEKQRLALATAIVGRPELVFLDEPTAGLDPQARHLTWDLVEELRRDGVTVVLTTHHMDEAERLADQVYVLDHGRAIAAGTPSELTTNGGSTTVSFTGRPDLPLEELRGQLPQCTISQPEPGTYRIVGPPDPQLLATLTAWCASHDVLPEGLSVGRHSLEDVFLELTGRELRP